jgi:hypothetical protein
MALRISIAKNIPDIDNPNNLLDARSFIPQELRHQMNVPLTRNIFTAQAAARPAATSGSN